MTTERAFDLQEIFIQDCRFRNLSPATIKDYDWFLTDIKNRLGDWQEIDRNQIKKLVLEKMESGQSPATANHYIRAIKAFYSFLHKEGHIDSNIMAGLSLISMPEKLKSVLEPKQISGLLGNIPENGFYATRDKVMILMLWDTAMRLKELLAIKAEDVDLKFGTVKITGKGRKDRIVPFGHKTKREIIRYLKIRGDNHSDFLFCSRTGYPIMPRNFRRTLKNYGKRIGLNVSPHLLRHSAATFLARNEMPAQHIQILLGHSSLAVTQNYINRIVAQEGLQVSHRRLSPGDRI
jgi:integrase/recombinase XerD